MEETFGINDIKRGASRYERLKASGYTVEHFDPSADRGNGATVIFKSTTDRDLYLLGAMVQCVVL